MQRSRCSRLELAVPLCGTLSVEGLLSGVYDLPGRIRTPWDSIERSTTDHLPKLAFDPSSIDPATEMGVARSASRIRRAEVGPRNTGAFCFRAEDTRQRLVSASEVSTCWSHLGVGGTCKTLLVGAHQRSDVAGTDGTCFNVGIVCAVLW